MKYLLHDRSRFTRPHAFTHCVRTDLVLIEVDKKMALKNDLGNHSVR
jgi:hypothetical protein